MSTKLCVDVGEYHYEVWVPQEDMTGDEFVDDLVRPLMLAMGYAPQTVSEALNDEVFDGPEPNFDGDGAVDSWPVCAEGGE